MTNEFHNMSALDLAAGFRSAAFTPVEVADTLLARIEAVNPALNCFCLIDAETTRQQAREAADRWSKKQPLSPLDGVPISIKDLVLTKGWPTRRGSLTVDPDGPWDEDSPPVAAARAAGMVFLGKVTTPEFGWKASTDSPLTGITRNPWNLDKTPGGSSGGSSAAIAAGLGPLSIGSDGGGSIRIPASFTGIFGLKPSFGRVPAYPPSHTLSLAHYGPMSKTVADSAAFMDVLTRPDARDWHGLPYQEVEYHTSLLREGIAGKRIAYSPRLGYVEHVWTEIEDAVRKGVELLEELGAEVEQVGEVIPHPGEAFITLFWGGAAYLLGELPEKQLTKLEPALRDVVLQAGELDFRAYLDAVHAREAIGSTFNQFMENYDFLVTPTVAVPPFDVGKIRGFDESGDELVDWTPFTYPFNMTKNPAASVPCGFMSDGLPIGLQLVGRMYQDLEVLQAAATFEQAHPLFDKRPPRFS